MFCAGLMGCFIFVMATTSFAQEGDEYFFGLATHRVVNVWEALFVKSFEWYCEDHGYKCTSMEAGNDPATQITQVRRMVDMGVDGLVIGAVESTALIPAVEYAKEHNVPVITANVDIYSPDVLLYIGFSGFESGKILAEEIVKYLRDEVEPIGEVKGTVLEIRGTMGSATGEDRHNGFVSVLDEYPEVRVITVVGDWDMAQAKTAAETVLRAYEVDTIYGDNGPMAMGAVGAIEALGKNPQDYFVATIDALPEALEAIGEGKIDVALDQPCPFYTPLAVYYLVEFLEKGEEALPKPGDIVTAEDVNIEGKIHQGVDIWAHDEMWAPAPVVETEYGHPWMQTRGILVTKDNYTLESLWANFELEEW